MVVRLSVAQASKAGDDRLGYNVYNVAIGHDRIPAVVTQCPIVLSRWLKGVFKATRHSSATTVVGVSAAHDNRYNRYHPSSAPFDLISFYIGSNCLLFLPPDYYHSKNSGKYLSAFFDNPSVVAVAPNARDLSALLEKHHGIRFRTLLDVNDDVALNGLRRRIGGEAADSDDEEDDVRGLSLDELAEKVFGRDMVLEERSEGAKNIMMYDQNCHWYGRCHLPLVLGDNRVKYSTLDSYLCYLIASEFVDDIRGGFCAPVITSDKKKTKKKNRKNKKKHH